MRDRLPLLLIGGLLLMGALASFLSKGVRRGDFADRLSTYRSAPDGSRALYLLLEGAGVKPRRWQQDLAIIDPKTSLVLFGARFASVSSSDDDSKDKDEDEDEDDDDSKARRFAGRDGGEDLTLEELDDRSKRGFNSIRSPKVEQEEVDALLTHVRNGATVLVVLWGHQPNALTRALEVGLTQAAGSLELRTLVPNLPSAYTLGANKIEARVQSYLELPSEGMSLLIDDGVRQPVLGLVPWGQGRVLLLTAPELAMNQALLRADNAQLWLSLGGALAKKGPLAFDEYHHGFTGERSMGDFLARYGVQFAVAQLILGLVAWALSLRRFGQPTPPPEEERVGSTDALFATSRMYREGGHHHHAAHSVVRELAAFVAPLAGVSARAAPDEVASGLRARGHQHVAERFIEVNKAAAAAHSEQGVLHVAQQAAAIRAALFSRRARKRA